MSLPCLDHYTFPNFNFSGERTHQIPIEGLAKKGDTYRKIWLDLLRFVNPEQTALFPPVYCRVGKCKFIFYIGFKCNLLIMTGNKIIYFFSFCHLQ